MIWGKMAAVAVSILLTTSMANSADEAEFSGFLSGYEKLETVPGEMASYVYISPEGITRAGTYHSLMIDQPEIFISEDSKYKGMKPADMTLIAETLRNALAAELGSLYEIVEEPGEGVLHFRFALGGLDLKKKKRGIFSYTPAGAVVHAGVNTQKSVMAKTNMRGVVVEAEMVDSQTDEVLAQVIDVRARRQPSEEEEADRPELSWELLTKMFDSYAKRMACRIRNGRLPAEERLACPASTLQDLIAEQEG